MRGIFRPAEVLRSPRQSIILHCERTEVRSSFTVWMWCIAVVLVDRCYVWRTVHDGHILRKGAPDGPPIPVAYADDKRRNVAIETLGEDEIVHKAKILLQTSRTSSYPGFVHSNLDA